MAQLPRSYTDTLAAQTLLADCAAARHVLAADAANRRFEIHDLSAFTNHTKVRQGWPFEVRRWGRKAWGVAEGSQSWHETREAAEQFGQAWLADDAATAKAALCTAGVDATLAEAEAFLRTETEALPEAIPMLARQMVRADARRAA